MPSVYPGALDALSTTRATGDVIAASTDNDLADAINKIEAELGVNPSAASADLVARLAALDALVALKAALAGPTFTGTVTVPTAAAGSNTTVAASTAFVNTMTIVEQTVSFTFGLGHVGTFVKVNSASAVVATVPANATTAFPIGTLIDPVVRWGVGTLTFAAATGVTIRGTPLTVGAQYLAAGLVKMGTDEWWLAGALG